MNPIVARYMAVMPKSNDGIVAKYMAAVSSDESDSVCASESSGAGLDLANQAAAAEDVAFLLKAIEDFARGKPATKDLMMLMGAAAIVRYPAVRCREKP
jgi:hypothetical protein